MSENKTRDGGIGFTSLLLLAFIVLKLCKVINWSWWWVLSPLWVPVAAAIVGFVLYLVYSLPKQKKEADKFESKWNQRMREMQEQKRKAEEFRNRQDGLTKKRFE